MRKVLGAILLLFSLSAFINGFNALFSDFADALINFILAIVFFYFSVKLFKKKKAQQTTFPVPQIEVDETDHVNKGEILESIPIKSDTDNIVYNNIENNISSSAFFVVGNYKGELRSNLTAAVTLHTKTYKNKAYGGNTRTELKRLTESYSRIYKYSSMKTKNIEFVNEPENPYDENAIAVYFREYKVGYIRKEETESVRALLELGSKYYARINGGPSVTLGLDDELESEDGPYKMEIIFN